MKPLYSWLLVRRLAYFIAFLRISAIWLGLAGAQYSDWRQISGYFLMLTGWPDITIIAFARNKPLLWGVFASFLLAATSFGWSAAFVWMVARLRKATHSAATR
jgi:hypothetical protein